MEAGSVIETTVVRLPSLPASFNTYIKRVWYPGGSLSVKREQGFER